MAKVEVTFEDGKITALKVDGKDRLKQDLIKAMNTTYWREWLPGVAVNPVSNASVKLTGLEMSIYWWCRLWYGRFSSGRTLEVPVKTYDWMKYLLLALNPNAYSKLLD